MRFGGAYRRDDSLSDAGEHRLLAGPSDKLLDVGTNRNPRLGDELDTVLGDGRHGRSIDDFRIDRHLDRLEYVPAGQVDGGCHLEIEIDVGFLCGYECLDDVRYIAFRQIMRLEFIRVQMEPCFRSGYHLIDYQRSGNLAPAHQYKLQKRYPYTRQQCLEPQSDGDEIEKQPK